MPIKKEPQKRSVELTFELPGTPEQVWRAIATGRGITAWFVPTEVEPRAGGAVKFLLGPGMESQGKITKWAPPRQFAYEEPDWSGDAPPLGTEFVVEARDGGTCTVRLVHSLFTANGSWDDELEGMEKGWGPFFEVLRLYLQWHPGQPAASVRPTGNHAGDEDVALEALLSALGLGNLEQGAVAKTSANAPQLRGHVERAKSRDQGHLLLRIQQPAPGVALLGAYRWGEQTKLAVSLYFYGSDAEQIATREGPAWEHWMQHQFS
jgi:uncharacterized protein YndB with AHSA1/START domain